MAKQVLLIDDDRDAVEYLSVLLSEHGYDPLTAHDGSEGLLKIGLAKPDLIVLDVMMPKKSGFVLFGQLKQDPRYKDIPILMLTGVGEILKQQERRGVETSEPAADGFGGVLEKIVRDMRAEGQVRPEMFVDKPVDPDSFIAMVRKLIGS